MASESSVDRMPGGDGSTSSADSTFSADSTSSTEPRTSPAAEITFNTRKWVKPEDLNANGTLFGGSLLRWIDEEATIYAIIQLGNHRVVTKFISEINFEASAMQGDLIEMGLLATHFGRSSITMRAVVRNMITRRTILSVERLVFVSLDEHGRPAPHGYTEITYDRDRMPTEHPATGTLKTV